MQMQQHFQLAMEVVVILFCAAVLVFAWPRGTATWEMLVAIATIKHIIALHHLTNVNEFTCTAWTLANLRPCFCLTYVVVLQMLALKQQR
mmetsp:Transcript_48144/g.66850  ORF Transcript_48144/g.66850 Transcript_48144/m.66850 type:complete len:90 (+) Transcript_48144:324-593(+)